MEDRNTNERLTEVFSGTADAIRAKLHTQSGIAPENFATEISKISGEATTNIYHVSTLDERNKLNAKSGNICLVYSIQESEISKDSVFNTFTFKDSFVIDTVMQDYIDARFTDANRTCDVSIMYYDNTFNVNAYAEIDGEFKSVSIRYTSQDGLLFNLERAEGDLIDGNRVDLPANVYYEPMGGTLDQNLFKFGTIKELYFPGIYKYDGANWNYLDIGMSLNQPDLLKNKKGYTSNGTIVGSTDLNDYYLKNFKHYTELPESPEEGINYYIINLAQAGHKKIYITDSNYTNTTSHETIEFAKSPLTYSRRIYYLTNYNGHDYYISSEGSTIVRREGNSLVEVFKDSKQYYGVTHACVGNYVYMFSRSFGIKYDLATGTTQNIQSHSDFSSDSGDLIPYNNTLIGFRGNYMYTYSISSNSWSKKQITKDFGYNEHYNVLKVQGNYAYFISSRRTLNKMDLSTGSIVGRTGFSDESYVLAGSEYIYSSNYSIIYKINDDLDIFQVCILNINKQGSMFFKDDKMYIVHSSEDLADVVTINRDLNLNIKDFNLRDKDGLFISVDKDNGVTLPYKLVNEIDFDKVAGIYLVRSGSIYTTQVYTSDGTTFTKLFDYTA